MTTQTVALAGSPNAGKSVLFNALTGLNQKVGNYPGVTVERKTGTCQSVTGKQYLMIDLPGTYSLDPISLDEQVAIDVLLGRGKSESNGRPDIAVVVVDAANLERTLGLALEIQETGLPMVVALNMMDLAQKRGLKLNLAKLQKHLGCPAIPLVATRGDGLPNLLASIENTLTRTPTPTKTAWTAPTAESITQRYKRIDQILADSVETPTRMDMLSWRIDQVVLHPVWGTLILLAILMIMFQSVFTWAKPLADGIDGGFTWLATFAKAQLPESLLRDLLTEGVIAGVGSVLVFLPQIVILFFCINLLEASGYMTRAAFLLDRMMHSVGLQGRSFVPLLSSFACAIPGIMATRTIRSDRDRLVTLMVAPLIPCSARLPVYTLLISTFVPAISIGGIFQLQALTMLLVFMIGVASSFGVAWITKITGGQRARTPFLLEMPSYRMPHWRYVFTSIWLKARAFLQRAGTVIMGMTILLWILSSFPKAPANATEPAIHYSFAGRLGEGIAPVVAPLGFDWRIATGLIPGMAAREVMVSSLATVFAVESAGNDEAQLKSLSDHIRAAWTPATGLALIAWYIFAPQCVSTIATVRRETGGWKWALVMVSYMFTLAWLAAFTVYHVATQLLS